MQKKKPELKEAFVQRMKTLLGKEFKDYKKILDVEPVRSIRVNTLKITPKDLKKRLEEKGWTITQPWNNYPEVMIIEGKIAPKKEDATTNQSNTKSLDIVDLEPGELGRALEHLLGYYYIQELASMLPVIALEPKENETVLDLCAAPGSKTTQIASNMKGTGTLIANEMSLGRIKILASNLERCGVANTIITRKEGAALCLRLQKQGMQFDKILIDAPCSGEGTLRSSPKTYIMWNPKTITSLAKVQKQLVKHAIPLLKKDAALVYSTCTHAPEENEAVVDYVLSEFPEMKIEKITLPIKARSGIKRWQEKTLTPDVEHACRIYPQDNNTEGFFVAKFRRIK